MLKIEKNDYQTIISLQKRKKILTKSFLISLSITFILHLGAYLFFKIGPFKIISDRILPPAFVESDLFEQQISFSTKNENEGRISRFSNLPKATQPEINLEFNVSNKLNGSQKINFLDNPFIDIES